MERKITAQPESQAVFAEEGVLAKRLLAQGISIGERSAGQGECLTIGPIMKTVSILCNFLDTDAICEIDFSCT